MTKRKTPEWYRILEAARRLHEREEGITLFSLGEEAEITPPIASGWLSKFARWQYVIRGKREAPSGRTRWVQFFELTEWGLVKQAPKKALF